MKSIKRRVIQSLSLIAIMLLCFFPSLVKNSNDFYNQKIRLGYIEPSGTTSTQSIWNAIEQSQLDRFELNVEIVGYRIISTDIDPIRYDENGHIFIVKDKDGLIDLFISLKFGEYQFDNIPIRGYLEIKPNYGYFFSYNIDDPKKGFFMDLLFFSDSIQLDLAFDGGGCQLCYNGIYNQGYNEISPLFPHIREPDQISEDSMRTSINKQDKLIIYNQEFIEKNSSLDAGILGISFTNYGVSHECFDFGVSYPEELPDNYWEPYTSIDIGIYRLHPSEAQVKSDLQTYNLDYVEGGHGFFRDILAYSMGTHGGPFWEIWGDVKYTWGPFWWWRYERIGYIYPDEIEALWYHYYDPVNDIESDVYPYDTIIMSDSCYGYCKPPLTNPTMAKAFVHYGASAFVGATISPPGASDTYMRAFWNDLCQGNYNVEHATITLCDTYGQGWNLYDEWRIYGDFTAKLP